MRDVERDVVGQECEVQGVALPEFKRARWGRLSVNLLIWSFVLAGCGDDAPCVDCVDAALSDGATDDGSVVVDGGVASSDGSIGGDASSDAGASLDGAWIDGDVPDGGEDCTVGASGCLRVSVLDERCSEQGQTALMTVSLARAPTEEVRVFLTSSDEGEGRPDQDVLVFTPTDWNGVKQVVVTGVDDAAQDGDQSFFVGLTTTSEDPSFDGLLASADFLNEDDDSAALRVTAPSGATREEGTTASFQMQLTTRPTADVRIRVASSDPTEGRCLRNDYTITPEGWESVETVIIAGQDDDEADGARDYEVRFTLESEDEAYDALVVAPVMLTNVDDDSAGYTVTVLQRRSSESGAAARVSVRLNTRPAGDVSVPVRVSDEEEARLEVAHLRFSVAEWNVPVTLEVEGVDDAVADGDQPYTLVFDDAVSSDAAYAGRHPSPVELLNEDDDVAGIRIEGANRQTSEGGGTAVFSISLRSRPTDRVELFVASDSDEAQIDEGILVFSPEDWNRRQTLTVRGLDDHLADGNQSYEVTVGVASFGDPTYAALPAERLSLVNVDDDEADVRVRILDGVASEGSDQAVVEVRLTAEPTQMVSFEISFDDDMEVGHYAPQPFDIGPWEWREPKVLTISGLHDGLVDGDQTFHLSLRTRSEDAAFDGLSAGPYPLTMRDLPCDNPELGEEFASTGTGDGRFYCYTPELSDPVTRAMTACEVHHRLSSGGCCDRGAFVQSCGDDPAGEGLRWYTEYDASGMVMDPMCERRAGDVSRGQCMRVGRFF